MTGFVLRRRSRAAFHAPQWLTARAGPGAGSSGRGGAPGIPAVGTDHESAERLRLISIGGDDAAGTYAPRMANSDHYNFARHGIPALRLVGGFDRPASNIRYILTRGDTRDKVQRAELTAAARLAAILVWRGLTMSADAAAALRR